MPLVLTLVLFVPLSGIVGRLSRAPKEPAEAELLEASPINASDAVWGMCDGGDVRRVHITLVHVPKAGGMTLSCTFGQQGGERSLAARFGCGGFSPGDDEADGRRVDFDITAMHYPYSELVARRGCAGGQYEDVPAGAHQNRECKDCIAEPACPWNQYRSGCGGTSPGECVYDCDPKYLCFVGHSGTSWFLAVTQWSKHVFPAYPHLVRVGGGATESEVTLSAPSGHAAKGVIVTKNGKISVRRTGGGKLQIGEA